MMVMATYACNKTNNIQTITKPKHVRQRRSSSLAAAATTNLCASCDKIRCDGQIPCSACKNNYLRTKGKSDETHKLSNVTGVDPTRFGCFYSPAKRRGPVPGHKQLNGTAAGGCGGGVGSLEKRREEEAAAFRHWQREVNRQREVESINDDDDEVYAAAAAAGPTPLGSATAEGDAGRGGGGNKQASMSSEPMAAATAAKVASADGSLERAIAAKMGVTRVAKPKSTYSQENIQSTNNSIKDRLRTDYILTGTVPKKSADQHAQRMEIVHAPPKVPKKKRVRIWKTCNVPGCTNVAKNGGRCTRHGAAVQLCSVSGCTNRAQVGKLAGGRCARHGATFKQCSEDGCESKAKLQGKCWKHGGKKACTYEGCKNLVQRYGYCRKHCKEVHGDVSFVKPDGTKLTLREFGKKRKKDSIEHIELPPEEPVLCVPVVGATATATQAAAVAAAVPQQQQNDVDFGPNSRDVAWGNEDEEDYEDAAIKNAIDSLDKITLLEQRYDKALARQRETIAGLRAQLTSLASEVHTSKSEVNTLKTKIVTDKDKYVGLGSEYRRVVYKLEEITGEREESAFRNELCSDGEHDGFSDEEEQGDDDDGETENFSDDEHRQGSLV